MGVITLVPLENRTVDSTQPFGGVGAPNTPPALTTPLPNPVVLKDQQSTIDLSTYFTDPDGDSLSYQWQNIPAGLQGQTNGTITGAATTAGSYETCEMRALDGNGGISAWETFTITVNEPVVVEGVWNYPWHRIMFNSSGRRFAVHRDFAHPTQKVISYRSALVVSQGGVGMGTTEGRRETKTQLEHWVQNKLPGTRMFLHIDSNQIKVPRKADFNQDSINYDCGTRPAENNLLKYSDGRPMAYPSTASFNERSMYANAYSANYHECFIDKHLAWLTDATDGVNGDAYLLGAGVDGLFQDASSGHWKNKPCRERASGEIYNITGGSTDVQIDEWAGIPTDGSPDGGGFEGITQSLWMSIHEPTWDNIWATSALRRVRFDGGGRMTVRMAEPADGSIIPISSNDTSWQYQIFPTGSNIGAADFKDDGTLQTDTYDQSAANSQAQFRVANGYFPMFDYLDTQIANERAAAGLPVETYGRIMNTQSSAFLSWWGGGHDIRFYVHRGQLETTQCENFEVGRADSSAFKGSPDGNTYWDGITKENDIKFYVGQVEYGKMLLRGGTPKSQGFQGSMITTKVRGGCNPNDPTTLDAAYMLFYETLILFAGGGKMCPHMRLTNSLSCATETLIIALGGDPISEATYFTTKDTIPLQVCTIDEVTQPGGADRITLSPSTWGSRGWGQWHFWFPNDFLVVLHAGPRNADTTDWIPSYLAGGQIPDPVKDQFVLPSLPVGRAWYDWDPSTYINEENGENVRSGIYANPAGDGQPANLGRIDEIFTSDPSTPQGCGVQRGTGGESIAVGPREVRIFKHAEIPA